MYAIRSYYGTVNPDFSQIESDVTQIQFDPRDALFYPEKRPFFLDGLDLFQSPNNLIYTRRIVAPVGATKLTGTAGGTNIGVMMALDDPEVSRSGDVITSYSIHYTKLYDVISRQPS